MKLSSQDAMVLAALICGDLMERLPTMNDAIKYKLNGNKVYSFYLDAETQWDFIIGGKPRYNGTGHARDMEYLFGTGQAENFKYIGAQRLDQAILGSFFEFAMGVTPSIIMVWTQRIGKMMQHSFSKLRLVFYFRSFTDWLN